MSKKLLSQEWYLDHDAIPSYTDRLSASSIRTVGSHAGPDSQIRWARNIGASELNRSSLNICSSRYMERMYLLRVDVE